MTQLRIFSLLAAVMMLSACARIPVSSVELTDMLIEEGGRMHQLNIALVNKMFSAKQEKLDEFIQHEYLPKYIEEFTARIPEDTDLQNELPAILLALVPEVTERRNRMHRALEEQRIKLITKLELDYENFRIAALELRNLLVSAVKVEEEKQQLYTRVSELSQGKVDLNKVETAIDSFIIEAGNVSEKALKLDEQINNIIGNDQQ